MEKIKKKINVADFIANYRILLMVGGLMVGTAVMWLNINFAGAKELESSLNSIQTEIERNSEKITQVETQIKLIRKDLQYIERIFANNVKNVENIKLPSNQSK